MTTTNKITYKAVKLILSGEFDKSILTDLEELSRRYRVPLRSKNYILTIEDAVLNYIKNTDGYNKTIPDLYFSIKNLITKS